MGLEVKKGPKLAERTTLRLGGDTLAEVVLVHPEDAEALGETLKKLGGTPLPLGGGSNLLAKDGLLPLVAVTQAAPAGPEEVRGGEGGRRRVRVPAGMSLPRFLAWLTRRGLSGLEGLAGVPGTVGGAVAGNAGSFGCDVASVLARVRLWTPESGLAWLGREGFATGYRHFAPRLGSGFFLVLEAEMDFAPADPAALRAAGDAALAKKRASQPIAAATAGCVFVNPEGEFAGRLLEQAGFRGRRLGNMAFSALHANFLVNCGGGTSDEALELIEAARAAVRRGSGHDLQLEVRIVP